MNKHMVNLFIIGCCEVCYFLFREKGQKQQDRESMAKLVSSVCIC